MSQYTTQLRYIVDVNSTPGKNVTERCKEAAPKIFPPDWEYFDEAKKLDFETAFLRHFYMQEICCETVGLWKIMLYDWLWTNMPYYNRKLKALSQEYDFLNTFDYTEKGTSSGTENSTEKTNENGTASRTQDTQSETTGENTENRHGSGSGHSFVKNYDFPSNIITTISDHITNASETNSNAENAEEHTTNNTENTTGKLTENSGNNKTLERTNNLNKNSGNLVERKGRSGNSPAALMRDYLEAIQNVYSEIFEKADVLFMGLW